ncbi:MAG TPA: hypothetical protein VJH21_02415 [Candidatus Paceibacterota bacterium]
MLRQNINSILSMILLGSVALGASLIIIHVSNLDPLSTNLSVREVIIGE